MQTERSFFFSYPGPVPKVTAEYRDARRTQVLDAARRCFVRDGFHATSMADVCREAGVSAGVAYLYFRGKDDIIAAIAEQNLDGIVQAARRLAAEHGHRGAGMVLSELLAYIRDEHQAHDTAAIALLTWSESLRNAALAERLDTAFTEVNEIFIGLLRDTPDASETEAPATASTLAYTFIGYVMRLATQTSDGLPTTPRLRS
jgi:TetR/AcrR family transcriptional regulator, transcriptional repressor of aconitase